MPEKYQGAGFSVLYPETWKLEEDPESHMLTLETPTGSFLSITPCSDVDQAFKQAQAAMEAEYDEVESEPASLQIADHTLTGIIQRFVFLDLIVASQLYKLESGGLRFLMQIQGEDREIEQQQAVFQAILTSLCQSLSPV